MILGVAYNPDVADVRDSPALDLIQILSAKGAEVAYHDPHVTKLDVDGISMVSVNLDRRALQGADCVVVTTAHRSYEWQWIVDDSQLVIDTRNATKDVMAGPGRVVKL